METVRVTAPDLDRRAAMEVTRSRLVLTAAGFLALFLAVVLKLADATVIQPVKPRRPEHPIAQMVQKPQQMDADSLAQRAMITDRNGQILAISLPTAELYADPRQVMDPAAIVTKLQQVVPDLDVEAAERRLNEQGKQFVFLARRITPQQEIEINNLGIPGIDFEPTEERHYPMKNVAAHVLGGVDIDEHGVAGVEKWFDKRLMSDPTPLRLSLDVRVQAVVRDALQSAIDEFKAEGGAAVVMDANTGEVLAMVSLPDYDANDFGDAPADARFNRAVSGAYEPGSTFKLQTVAMALDSDVIHLWDQFDTVHPIHIGRFTITDFETDTHNLEVPEIVAYSSNIGASHIAVLVGAERQRAWLKKLGFFVRSPIQLPESAPPIVQPARSWQLATIMTVSFGNGIAVTPMQLMAGTDAIVDGGFFRPPTLLALPPGQDPAGEQVMKPETSEVMRKLMRLVVTQGTGTPAKVPGYLVGAKTGTSQKVGAHGYKLHENLSLDDRRLPDQRAEIPRLRDARRAARRCVNARVHDRRLDSGPRGADGDFSGSADDGAAAGPAGGVAGRGSAGGAAAAANPAAGAPIAVADPTYEPAKKPVERSEEKRRDVIVPAALPRRGTDERWQRQASLDGARVVPTAAETSVAGH